MKMKYMPLMAFAILMIGTSAAEANIFGKPGRKFVNTLFRDCTWDYNNPVDSAITNYERITTQLPAGMNRKVIPFKESDLQTKPWIREYEYVVVINNSNSYKQNEVLPATIPMNMPVLSQLGIMLGNENSVMPAQSFNAQHGHLALQVRKFGSLERDAKKKPVMSGIPGAQTVRIYQRGQLIRVAKISTGRHEFELRDRIQACGNRPADSYYSVTESGYYNFQELVKDFKSKSYDEADMPNSMFYIRNRGIALHEVNLSEKIASLGRRASGGCTRMDPNTALTLFEAIQSTRGANIPVIDIQGNPVLDAQGRQTYKNREMIVYNQGEQRERQSVLPSYNALLIMQPDSVQSASTQQEKAVQYRFQ